ncbi:aminodeoxychorismate/anthranilate synthase component II [Halobacillus sp. Marseille-Q1614]|uniref:anthranilate synthase component II n=1 Tax=Halobacillus sp. Marseille-Q1614 TaxID=2709134 RepID=UPI0015706CA8|nr:aminodeoxychorismate/anthranilate synthase component II [Halobacillus sp. Marseille-Q1614]
MILLIDNYDSFTYNLFQYFKQMTEDVEIVRNNDISIEDIERLSPALVVFSPGPGTPADAGVCREILDHFHKRIPILGVCLGHQVIVEYFGGKIEKAMKPMHGKVVKISHDNRSAFKNLPSPLKVTRYHSLQASRSGLPLCLEVSAVSEGDEAVMGIRHKYFPVEGIQFHPESIITDYGFEILNNFYQKALTHQLEVSR